jgi:hypothetical protein
MEILELREELGEARAARDDAKVARMGEAMRARAAEAAERVAAGLTAAPGALTTERLEGVARELVALRYYRRFLDEVAAHDDAREGVAHG